MPPRKRKGFRRVGEVGPNDLGLPLERGRALLLGRAWSEVAGAVVAERARAMAVRRGILEVRVPEGPWAETLIALIPRLAGRLSSLYPDLGVKKFRVVRGETARGTGVPAIAVERVPPLPAAPAGSALPEPSAAAAPDLRDLMRRYLDRGARARSGGGQSA